MGAYILREGSPKFVTFDLTMNENHERTATVTEHPVEKGAPVTDHVKLEPVPLHIVFYVTNTPIVEDPNKSRGAMNVLEYEIPRFVPPFEPTPGGLFRAAQGNVGPRSTKVAAQLLTFEEGVFDAVKEKWEELENIIVNAEILTVVTTTKTYENMLLIRIGMPKNEYGGATFDCTFRQIKIVESKTVPAPQPVELRGAPKVAKGAQEPKETKTEEKVKAKSAAKKLVGFLQKELGV